MHLEKYKVRDGIKPNTFDEGFNIELVETAFFDGKLEIPIINPPKKIVIPSAMIPF